MKEGPDIAQTAALIGDPARANMLVALLAGHALTASELANEAGVTKQTASSHLAQLTNGGLLAREVQGRHHYFRLNGTDVAAVLEALMGVSAAWVGPRTRPGPRDPALRHARVCYDHLAGEMGVQLYEHAQSAGWMNGGPEEVLLTDLGRAAFGKFDINYRQIEGKRRPLCRACLDWSMRRHHLAGGLGKALLQAFYARGWAHRLPDSRAVTFTPKGAQAFQNWLS